MWGGPLRIWTKSRDEVKQGTKSSKGRSQASLPVATEKIATQFLSGTQQGLVREFPKTPPIQLKLR